jgi:hypothetical protein
MEYIGSEILPMEVPHPLSDQGRRYSPTPLGKPALKYRETGGRVGDIVATTSNPVVIRSAYRNALPVVYDPPSPEKIHFNKRDLFNSDLFGFGSIIGSITNKSSDMYAMLPVLEEKYGKDSEEVKLIESRLKQCCAAQSRQIDQLVTLRGNSY